MKDPRQPGLKPAVQQTRQSPQGPLPSIRLPHQKLDIQLVGDAASYGLREYLSTFDANSSQDEVQAAQGAQD